MSGTTEGTDDDGDDRAVDLGISIEIVAAVVDMAHALHDAEEAVLGPQDDDEDPLDVLDEDDDEDDDAPEETLAEYIGELNEEQQNALIALAWVGRGDYEPEEWDEAVRLAAERNAKGDAGTYLTGMEGLGDLLSEGAAAFGLAIEDVER
jgi:hypothetical protein